MKGVRLLAMGLGALVAFGSPPVRADSYWELEHARANARAGGPISERDAELLERYGCLSGTRSAFCDGLRHGHRKSGSHVRRLRDRERDD